MSYVHIEGQEHYSNPKWRELAYLNLFTEASYDGDLLQPNRDYCIILNSSSDLGGGKSEMKSEYVRYLQGRTGDRLLWRKPFGDKMLVLGALSNDF